MNMDDSSPSASMPLLRSLFFKTYPPKAEFWAEWKSMAPWTEQLCPIYSWEGTLFIGCTSLEAVSPTSPKPQKIILVLCEEQVLKEYFDLMSSMQISALVATPPSAPSEDLFGSMAASLTGETEDSLLKEKDDEEHESESKESETSEEPIVDQIAGLTMDLSAQTVTLIPLNSSTSKLEPSAPVTPVITETSPVAPAVAQQPNKTGDMSEHIFKEMQGQFIKSMLFRKEGNALIPWKWDSKFQPAAQAQDNPLSLGQPSPFRIVAKTLKPYHGYISPCDIAEKFFEDWNSSQIPDHLTVVPIIIEEEMVGALLGIAEKSVNQKASLHLTERLASEMEMSMRSDLKEVAS
jgi:hypothetical protein